MVDEMDLLSGLKATEPVRRGLVESLVINVGTGLPVALLNRVPGQPLNATYYHTFRVTLAKVEAGKF